MSLAAVPILLGLAGIVVFFSYATTRHKATVAFFVTVMTASAALAIWGAVLLASPETAWQGLVLACFGLLLMLAAMVACLLLCGKREY